MGHLKKKTTFFFTSYGLWILYLYSYLSHFISGMCYII